MTIDRDEAMRELLDRGLTPHTIEGPDGHTHFWIESQIIWDKLFTSLDKEIEVQKDKELENFLTTIKHRKLIRRVIISRDPKLDWIDYEGKKILAVVFPEIIERGEKLPHLTDSIDREMHLVSCYMMSLLDRFE